MNVEINQVDVVFKPGLCMMNKNDYITQGISSLSQSKIREIDSTDFKTQSTTQAKSALDKTDDDDMSLSNLDIVFPKSPKDMTSPEKRKFRELQIERCRAVSAKVHQTLEYCKNVRAEVQKSIEANSRLQ